MDSKTQYRSQTLYVTNQLSRWLVWLASLDEGQTADAIAEGMLRDAILAKYPKIEEAEAHYQSERKKLNTNAREMLKSL